MSRLGEVLGRLEAVIEARRDADPETSWTARLLRDGPPRAARKLGEEAVEAIVAAVSGDRDGLAAEAADVLYHLLVLLAAAGVSADEVAARLEAREGASGLEEQAARTPAARRCGGRPRSPRRRPAPPASRDRTRRCDGRPGSRCRRPSPC